MNLGKFLPAQATTALWGIWGTAPLILILHTSWKRVVSFTPRPNYHQRKHFLYLSSRKLGGLQSRSRNVAKDKNPLPVPEIEPRFLGCPAHSAVTAEKIKTRNNIKLRNKERRRVKRGRQCTYTVT